MPGAGAIHPICFGSKADIHARAFAMGGKRFAAPLTVLVRSRDCKEKTMNTTRIPGNEPDPGDMSTEPSTEPPNDKTKKHDLPDDEAEKLGNFA